MVRYGQSGYSGQSRSIRACTAESDGKLPLSRAVKAVAENAGVTQTLARKALTDVGPCEWHHTGKFAARTDYYSVNAALNWLALESVRAALPPQWKSEIDSAINAAQGLPGDERMASIMAAHERLAQVAGTDAATIENLYYGIYEDF